MQRITVVIGVVLAMLGIIVLPCHGQVINGCYQKNQGSLRIVQGADECRSSEVFIQWNKIDTPSPAGTLGSISIPDLIGVWKCLKFVALPVQNAPAGYTAGDLDGFFSYASLILTFIDDGDGTYSYMSAPRNAIQVAPPTDYCNGSGRISSFNGYFVMELTACSGEGPFPLTVVIKRRSNTEIEMSQHMGVYMGLPGLICQKQ